MASIREGFTAPDVAQGDFYSAQQIRYNQVEPNRFLPDKMKENVGTTMTNDVLSQFNSFDPYTESTSNKFTAAGLAQVLQGQGNTTDEESFCRGFTGAEGVNSLRVQQSADTPIRCGWRYKKSPGGGLPLISQGALGTINGPLNTQEDVLGSGTRWFWNLDKAYNQHFTDFAATQAASASGLATTQASFSNTAFCTQTNTFIQVDSAGVPLQGFTCPPASIVTNPANFPPPTPSVATAAAAAASGSTAVDLCKRPGNNPSLSRDCLLLAVKNNGCSPNGTLYQAIQSERPSATNYNTYLQTQSAFLTYQSKQGANKLTDDVFNRNRGTYDMAEREIRKLHGYTQVNQDPVAKKAAEDLCLTAGLYDTYDFCSDITDSTSIGAVDLKCMQNLWQEKNGKPAGLLYPVSKTLKPELGAITTWGQFKTAVDTLKTQTSATDPLLQRRAINNFLGVSVGTDAFTPLNLDGLPQQFALGGQPLVFWLDAYDLATLTIDQNNRISTWRDKSGRSNNVVQTNISNRPTLQRSTRPTIEFSGAGQFIPIPNGFSLVSGNNFTVFVVERRKSSKNNNFFLGGTTGGRNQNLVLGYVIPTLLRYAFFANDVDATVSNFANASEPTRLSVFEKTPTGRTIYINGTQSARDSNREVLTGWTGAAIGRFGSDFYQGSLCEILIFNPGLSLDRRQKVEGYLSHKWGIAGNLPPSHPFKTASP